MIMREQALDDDMATFDQAQMAARTTGRRLLQELGRPWPGRIHDAARAHQRLPAAGVLQGGQPGIVLARTLA